MFGKWTVSFQRYKTNTNSTVSVFCINICIAEMFGLSNLAFMQNLNEDKATVVWPWGNVSCEKRNVQIALYLPFIYLEKVALGPWLRGGTLPGTLAPAYSTRVFF